MDCIPFIKNLLVEIEILEDLKRTASSNEKEISKKISEKKETIERCKSNLSKLENGSIEYRLYLYILNGLTPSKAVAKVADENFQNDIKPSSENRIWRDYYKKIKNFL